MNLRQIHREDVFGPSLEQVQTARSKVKVTRDKTGKTAESSPLTMHCNACAIGCKPRAAGEVTRVSQPAVTG